MMQQQDEIIEMARQAGLLVIGTADGGEAVYTWPAGITEELEAFAKLVAAKEREAFVVAVTEAVDKTRKATLEEMIYEHPTTAIKKAVEYAVKEEREACAKVAKQISDKYAYGYYGNEVDTADEIEAAIRARGEA